ncbi:MAG: glycosyltransferase [Methanoregula sp.]
MTLKISIGMNLRTGPWGGGNQFGQALSEYLMDKGHQVVFSLNDQDIDIILLCEPRKSTAICAFNHKDILWYLLLKNRNALVVHRINECDERKGTTNMNNLIMNANTCADHTIFISRWLQELYKSRGMVPVHSNVIMNGADQKIFNNFQYRKWNTREPLKVVTHHWGGGGLKGYDIYKKFDEILMDKSMAAGYEFTYIGKLPKNITFNNSHHIQPLAGVELASEIQKHHVYLTASQYEPAGMHHIEGALCGLPVLYRDTGGAIPEYCHYFGIEFNEENFQEKLHEMTEKYECWVKRMESYPYTAEKMCHEYLTLFNHMVRNREEYLQSRTWLKNPFCLLKNIVMS